MCGEKGSPLFEEGEVNSDGGGAAFKKGIDRSLQLLSPLHSPHQPQF